MIIVKDAADTIYKTLFHISFNLRAPRTTNSEKFLLMQSDLEQALDSIQHLADNYTIIGRKPRGTPKTVAVAPLLREADFFLPSREGRDAMYVTWELLFLFAGFLIALLSYIDNKKK